MRQSLSCALLLAGLSVVALPQNTIDLFPSGAPGAKNANASERDTTSASDALIMGRPVIRLGNVTAPTLTFYPAPPSNNSHTAVLVFPGGGYRILAYDLEGTEVCAWLNSIGVNAVLVKYRVPEPENLPRYQEPLEDAQRALSYVRSKASEWNLQPDHIGVLGFSAGGHLAALLSNNSVRRTYSVIDGVDSVSCRPDFALLVYPAYLATGPGLENVAAELAVRPETPPTFIVQTEDDPVHVENAMVYYRALQQKKVPAEMHIFSTGGHGYGLRPDPNKPVTEWPKLAQAWMRSRRLIP